MKKLTIGMCTYDDYEGVFFTIEALRLYHAEIMDQVEFIIIDNNPSSTHGRMLKNWTPYITEPHQYIPFDEYNSTFVKNKVFENARTPYVLCIDCHVLISPGAIKKLIDYYDRGLDDGNLLQGPLLHDCLKLTSTHFNKTWGGHMYGQWDRDEDKVDPDAEPFEINAQGMGLFSCRKDCWQGFNPLMRGFGGEEQYIHEKFRKKGKKVMCLPFLGWVHRFNRPNGVPYRNSLEDRYRNYIIGRMELLLDIDDVEENFKDALPDELRNSIKTEVLESLGKLYDKINNNDTVSDEKANKEQATDEKPAVSIDIDSLIKTARAQNAIK